MNLFAIYLSLAACLFAQRPASVSTYAVYVDNYGAFADGTSHPITAPQIAANTQWCGSYDVGDQWDYVALQEAEYAAFGCPGSEHGAANAHLNKPLIVPHGKYQINKPWTFINVDGGRIECAGRFSTTITQITATTAVFKTDGMGYSTITGCYFEGPSSGSNSAVVELDWSGSGQSLQANTFQDNFIGCNGTDFGVRIGKTGNMGSENVFLNNFVNNCAQAGYQTANYNALGNQLIGGNIQSCPKYGVWVLFGGMSVYGTGFQNGVLAQIAADGYDIEYDNVAGSTDVVSGIRSESARLVRALNSYPVTVDAVSSVLSFTTWSATATYTVDQLVRGTAINVDGKLYKVTVAGTTGGSQPTWNGGTVVDGSVTYVALDFVSILGDGITLINSSLPYSQVDFNHSGGTAIANRFTRTDWQLNEAKASWIGNSFSTTPSGYSLRSPPSATDPGCTVNRVGSIWTSTSATDTVLKICLLVSSSPTWVTK